MSRSDDIYANRQEVTYAIGYPDQINPTYGLMDGSGAQLQRVLGDQGISTDHGWLGFDQAYATYSATPGLMSGQGWYHWVAVRGVQGSNLWISNSAPGYAGIFDTLSRYDYDRLGGFSNLWVTD